MYSFDPALSWLQLLNKQRLLAEGYVTGKGKALKVSPELLLPRQTSAPDFAASIRLCEINRNSTKQLFISKLIHGGEDLEHVAPFEFFQKLEFRKTPAECLYVYFDTRLGRDQVLDAVRAEKQCWGSNPRSGSTRLKRSQVWVIPSNDPPFAIFLVPANCDKERLVSALHTQLMSSRRREWFPRCVDHWKTCTVNDTELVRDRDGSIQIDARGFPVRRRVIRHLFDPTKHLPPEQKPRKSAGRHNLLLGLAANDVFQQKHSLSKSNQEVTFLLEQTKSLTELRNLQRSARRRLVELDAKMGRLDKSLDRCIQENESLGRIGFFTPFPAVKC